MLEHFFVKTYVLSPEMAEMEFGELFERQNVKLDGPLGRRCELQNKHQLS
jgi:hypothetical protein